MKMHYTNKGLHEIMGEYDLSRRDVARILGLPLMEVAGNLRSTTVMKWLAPVTSQNYRPMSKQSLRLLQLEIALIEEDHKLAKKDIVLEGYSGPGQHSKRKAAQ